MDASLSFLVGGVAKASFKLALVSMKRPETRWSSRGQTDNRLTRLFEGRTRICCNRLGWASVSGEKPNEPWDSWFFAKYI